MSDVERTPRVFIGSSSEGLEIAYEIQRGLSTHALATVWDQAFFTPSQSTLETLTAQRAQEFDFAVFVMTDDDVVTARGHTVGVPRDNVVLEAGLAFGRLGRERTFIVHCRDTPMRLPSDLDGMTCLTFPEAPAVELPAALGPVCTDLRRQFRELGNRGADEAPGSRRPSRIVSGIMKGLQEGRPTAAAKVSRRRRRRSLATAVLNSTTSFNIANISITGALLETPGAIPIERLLEVDLCLNSETTVRVKARVVRIQRPDWGLAGGVAVRFEDVDRDTERVIHKYVHAADAVYCDEPDG